LTAFINFELLFKLFSIFIVFKQIKLAQAGDSNTVSPLSICAYSITHCCNSSMISTTPKSITNFLSIPKTNDSFYFSRTMTLIHYNHSFITHPQHTVGVFILSKAKSSIYICCFGIIDILYDFSTSQDDVPHLGNR
jgi:hypothetical protein